MIAATVSYVLGSSPLPEGSDHWPVGLTARVHADRESVHILLPGVPSPRPLDERTEAACICSDTRSRWPPSSQRRRGPRDKLGQKVLRADEPGRGAAGKRHASSSPRVAGALRSAALGGLRRAAAPEPSARSARYRAACCDMRGRSPFATSMSRRAPPSDRSGGRMRPRPSPPAHFSASAVFPSVVAACAMIRSCFSQ